MQTIMFNSNQFGYIKGESTLEQTMLMESSHESIQFTEAFEKLPPILVPEAIM